MSQYDKDWNRDHAEGGFFVPPSFVRDIEAATAAWKDYGFLWEFFSTSLMLYCDIKSLTAYYRVGPATATWMENGSR